MGMGLKTLATCAALRVYATGVSAQTPAFDTLSFKDKLAGPPTRVLVLGTPHLSNIPGFKPDDVAPVLERLTKFAPEIITIEALSGQQCDFVARYPKLYPGVASQYCASTETALKATGLDVPTAAAKAESLLASWPTSPRPAERRQLAATFLAAGERASALVQWLRLPMAEREAGDGLDGTLVKELNELVDRKNENFQIGAKLAAQLGLERVYAVDDHTSDSIQAPWGKPAEDAIYAIWKLPNPTLEAIRGMNTSGGENMLKVYRFVNLPATQVSVATGEFGAALQQKTPELYGRQYVAWWETRNLRMVANIRSAFGNKPGARVLVIVGSGHKAYFDAYLNQMHEVELVDTLKVLR